MVQPVRYRWCIQQVADGTTGKIYCHAIFNTSLAARVTPVHGQQHAVRNAGIKKAPLGNCLKSAHSLICLYEPHKSLIYLYEPHESQARMLSMTAY